MPKQNKKRKLGQIIGYLLDILLTLVSVIIIIGIYYIIQIKVLNRDFADMFGYTFFEVATGSMANTIEIGDVVIVKLTKEVNENDIIVYKDEDNFVTHRLILKDGEKLIAKGDANNSEDKPIKQEQILGQVIYTIPKIGIWRKVFTSPEILILIIIVIILLGITSAYASKTEEKNNE